MLVVISDLHFEEEKSDEIVGAGRTIAFQRNLPPAAFEQFMCRIASEAALNSANRLDLVLAGDIFDIHRSQLWFTSAANGQEARPYVDCSNVAPGSALENKVLEILDAIGKEPAAAASLAVFQRFVAGKYLVRPGDKDSLENTFPCDVALHYLPGNHDRLANATEATRAAARGLLGLPHSVVPFDHTFPPASTRPPYDPAVLVRHGHEYDRYNFSVELPPAQTISMQLPLSDYDGATLGDFVTIEVATGLPRFFREHHTDPAILNDRALEQIYLRLLEFDDVRPQSALLDFLLNMPRLKQKEVWSEVEPVVKLLLENVRRAPFLRECLRGLRGRWLLRRLLPAGLWLRVWKVGLPLWLFRSLYRGAIGGASDPGPERYAEREAVTEGAQARLVVAGHTHDPAVELIGAGPQGDQFYVDTGTWRNQVKATRDRSVFGRMKALTYVVVYASDEDRAKAAAGQPKTESIDYWSGLTQRW